MEKIEELKILQVKNSKTAFCEGISPEESLIRLIEQKKTGVLHLKKNHKKFLLM